jgi:hypothetical protein
VRREVGILVEWQRVALRNKGAEDISVQMQKEQKLHVLYNSPAKVTQPSQQKQSSGPRDKNTVRSILGAQKMNHRSK